MLLMTLPPPARHHPSGFLSCHSRLGSLCSSILDVLKHAYPIEMWQLLASLLGKLLPQMSTRLSHHPQDFSQPISPSLIILLSCKLTSPLALRTLFSGFSSLRSTYYFLINCLTSFFYAYSVSPLKKMDIVILFIIESSVSRYTGDHSSNIH